MEISLAFRLYVNCGAKAISDSLPVCKQFRSIAVLFRMNSVSPWRLLCAFGVASLTLLVAQPSTAKPRVGSPTMADSDASTVYFQSGDGQTELVGYVFKPSGRGPFPAIVMLHGRAGPYSTNVNAGCTFVRRGEHSACNAVTQSMNATVSPHS